MDAAPAPAPTRIRLRVERALIALLIAVISLPLLARVLPLDTAFAPLREPTARAVPGDPAQGLGADHLPRRFKKYWDDWFGLPGAC